MGGPQHKDMPVAKLARASTLHTIHFIQKASKLAGIPSHKVFCHTDLLFRKAMKLSVTMFLGLMLVMLAVTVSGKPKTYLIETVDNIDNPVTLLYVYIYTYIKVRRKFFYKA